MSYIKTHPGFSTFVMLGVLGAVLATGGAYGGYRVYKNYQGYGANFDGLPHTLVRVFDGDTFAVTGEQEVRNKKKEVSGGQRTTEGSGNTYGHATKDFVKVRLLGIDAPETGSCYAEEATRALKELLETHQFRTVKDEEAMDDNERLLRHVFLTNDDPRDGARNVSEELLRGGYAFARLDTRNSMYDRRYAAAEREARAAGAGLWSACKKEVDARVASDKRLQDSSREIESAVHKPGCDIKGNISTKGAGKVYYLPKCANYHMLILDARKGEQYFCTEAEAKKAGFVKSGSCENTF